MLFIEYFLKSTILYPIIGLGIISLLLIVTFYLPIYFLNKTASSLINNRYIQYILASYMLVSFFYILSWWAGFMAIKTLSYTTLAEVSHPWIYHIVGFSATVGLINWVNYKGARDKEDLKHGTITPWAVSLVYIFFIFRPEIVTNIFPYV